MRVLLLALAPACLLGGCAGYAIDYVKPKTSILAPELARYGMDARQSQCVGERLTGTLSVWQLRQLARSAGAVKQGYATPGRLAPPDLLWVARHVADAKVGTETQRAFAACGIGLAAAGASAGGQAVAAPPQPSAAAPPPAAGAPAAKASWVNLGAAPTGQAIAVDAASMAEGPSYRQAWFRLTNPAEATPVRTSYLLRIDCAKRTINSMAIRKHGPTGAVAEERDHGPGGEGAIPVEAGTVMEIAYLALCT